MGLDLLGYGRQENVHDVLFFLVGAEMTGPFPSVVSSLCRCRRDRYVFFICVSLHVPLIALFNVYGWFGL